MLSIGHNQRGTQIIKLLKSINALKQRVDHLTWKSDVKAGILLSKEATFKYLKMMTECMPVPNIDATKWVVQVCIDQLHLYRGCIKGRVHRSSERADKDTGKKVKVQSITVMNLHEYPVDNSELRMTEEEAETIRRDGPYTEPLTEVYDELDWDKSLENLYDFWREDCEILEQAMPSQYGSGTSDTLNADEITTVVDWLLILAARPHHQCSKTPVVIHKPLCARDTNCYDDIQSVWSWILQKFPEAVVIVVHSDGQCNGMFGNAKGIRPERYEACVPMAADMHAEGHVGVYATHELFFECLGKPVSDELGFEKILKKVMDLDKDRFSNHKDFQQALGVACKAVLVMAYGFGAFSDVRRLEQMVATTPGHTVIFYYALMAGGPSLMWQRAQRSDRMMRLNECWSWGFHAARATHKTNYQVYSVMRAHTIRCTHPRIQLLLHQHPSMSQTGRMGSMQAKDARLEHMHAECSAFNLDPKHSFEDALFFSEHFTALDHASSTWHEAQGLDYNTPVEAKAGFKATVSAMVAFIQSRIQLFDGNTEMNPFTGNHLYRGDYRIKQPWLFCEKVAMGNSGPLMCPRSKKTWRQVVTHILKKDMFKVSPTVAQGLDEEEDEDWGWLDDQVDDSTQFDYTQ